MRPGIAARLVCQLRTCVLAERGEELILLDQPGVHERILYERLSENPRREPVRLSRPAVARLPRDLAPEVWAFEEDLAALGFRVEPFGADAVRVLAAPLGGHRPRGGAAGGGRGARGRRGLAKALACRGSTRFGDTLTREEVETLLREWSEIRFDEVCPHGRPIVKRVALSDLLREFGRT